VVVVSEVVLVVSLVLLLLLLLCWLLLYFCLGGMFSPTSLPKTPSFSLLLISFSC